MYPFDFFRQQHRPSGDFGDFFQNQFTPEHLHHIKQMMKQYHSLLNEDFWKNIYGLSKQHTLQVLPIEIWESKESLFLSIIVPGLANMNEATLDFHSEQEVTITVKANSIKPVNAEQLLKSELPQQTYQREILLPKRVDPFDYTSSYERGVITYVLIKTKNEMKTS